MKKRVLLGLMACMFAVSLSAQEIFNEVKRMKASVETIANDTTKNLQTRKVACFKNDALYYLIDKAGKEDNFTEYELGQQATAMVDFVNLFVQRLSNSRKQKDKDIVLARFKNASVQHSLFNDMEKEITYGYVDNQDFITQFSLDTNWVEALQEVSVAR